MKSIITWMACLFLVLALCCCPGCKGDDDDNDDNDSGPDTILLVPEEYTTIQGAIDAAENGYSVLVANGRYRENIDFKGKNIVVSSYFSQDGDLNHILETIIDGSNPTDPAIGSCVRIVSGENETAVLTGFTLTGGTGTIWLDTHLERYYREGGGILIERASPTIHHNLIINNEAIDIVGVVSAGGGGIRCGDGNPLIRNNIIMTNQGRYGAGIVMNYSTGTIRNNIILNNTGGEDYGGSGIWGYEVGPILIENNIIIQNHSEKNGGGVLAWATTFILKNNIIWGNTATKQGDQIYEASGATVEASYNDVQDGWEGTGNINLDPLFAIDQFLLTSDSPCIDAGDPQSGNDPEDPNSPGQAAYPSMGELRNDMGCYGGPTRTSLPPFT
ncbi:right-handed parallel beta-helix repeat-containing protein [bacterium]|nr:right-handed parallel beta-helix repeat-containing protein [bacterium]